MTQIHNVGERAWTWQGFVINEYLITTPTHGQPLVKLLCDASEITHVIMLVFHRTD